MILIIQIAIGIFLGLLLFALFPSGIDFLWSLFEREKKQVNDEVFVLDDYYSDAYLGYDAASLLHKLRVTDIDIVRYEKSLLQKKFGYGYGLTSDDAKIENCLALCRRKREIIVGLLNKGEF